MHKRVLLVSLLLTLYPSISYALDVRVCVPEKGVMTDHMGVHRTLSRPQDHVQNIIDTGTVLAAQVCNLDSSVAFCSLTYVKKKNSFDGEVYSAYTNQYELKIFKNNLFEASLGGLSPIKLNGKCFKSRKLDY